MSNVTQQIGDKYKDLTSPLVGMSKKKAAFYGAIGGAGLYLLIKYFYELIKHGSIDARKVWKIMAICAVVGAGGALGVQHHRKSMH